MANLTLEQQRALALANARLRLQQQAKPAPKKKAEEDGGFLQDVKDTAIALGKSAIGIGESALPPLERLGVAPAGVKESLAVLRQRLESGRSAASFAEQARQERGVNEATPGVASKFLLNMGRGANLVVGSPDPIVQAVGLVGSALLPKTEEQAARQVAKVTTPFETGLGAAEFAASQVPATAATILTGGAARGLALARGIGTRAATDIGRRAAVVTGTGLNAADAGYSAAQDVLAKGGTQDEADRAYAIAAAGATVTSAVAAKLPGLEQRIFSTKATAPGALRGAVRTAAGEAPQEFIEEGGAKLAQNVAKLGTAAEVPIGEDVLSSGALGAIGGAGIAAPVGAVQGFVGSRAAAAEEQPAAQPEVPEVEPIRVAEVTIPNPKDVSQPINKRLEVLTEPDEEGYIKVREDGQVKDMIASDLDEMEAASEAYRIPPEEEVSGLSAGIPVEEEVAAAPEAEAAPEATAETATTPEPEVKEAPIVGGGAPIETPQGKESRVRRLMRFLQSNPAYTNFASKYSGAREADIAVAKSKGIDQIPESESLYDKFEVLESSKSGKLSSLNRNYIEPLLAKASEAAEKGVTKEVTNDFLQSRAARDRNAKIARRNEAMPDGGSGIPDALADAMQAEARTSGNIRDLNQIAKMHDRLRDYGTDALVEGGVISQEQLDQWRAEEKDYTPFKGWAAGGDNAIEGQEDPHADYGSPIYTRQFGFRGTPIKRAEGRESKASDSLTNMIADVQQQVELAERNKVNLFLKKQYDANPSAFNGLLTIYTENNPKIVKGRAAPMTDPIAYKDSIPGFDNGKRFFIDVVPNESGAALKSAFQNMDPPQYFKFVKRAMDFSGFFRQLNTRLSPYFWPIDFIRNSRDAVDTILVEQGIKGGATYEKSWLKARANWANTIINHFRPSVYDGVLAYLTNRDPLTEEGFEIKRITDELTKNGGAAGFEFAERAAAVAKRIEAAMEKVKAEGLKNGTLDTKAGLIKAMKMVDGINEFTNLLPRVTVYKALIDADVDAKDAARVALRSTLDTTKSGRYGRLLDSIYWFTTPQITNLTKKLRVVSSKYGRELMIANVATSFGIAMMNLANAPDSDDDGEDDFSQLPEWKKMAFTYLYYSKDANPIPIPNGFLFAFEKYIGVKMAEVLSGKISDAEAGVDMAKATSEVASAFFSGLVPVIKGTDERSVVPSLLAPSYDLGVNENFFNSPIYNEPFDKSIAKASISKPNTPEIYKKMARGLQELDLPGISPGFGQIKGDIDISPDQLKYFVDQYTGGPGRLVRDIANPEKSAIAKANPFSFDESLIEGGAMSRFYERSDEMKRGVAAVKKSEEGLTGELEFLENSNPVSVDLSVIDAYKEAEKALKELRESSYEMDATEYNAERSRIMSDFNRTYNDVKRGQ
jgi:hypothetical protein